MMNYQSDNISELATALCSAQGDLQPATKDGTNPHLKNKYTTLSSVFAALREVLPKHGLAVAQTLIPSDDGKAHVRTTLMHKSGQWIAGECAMPLDQRGGPQGMGSAITYARRYSLSAIVGVVSEDDDDGEAAQGKGSGRSARSGSNGGNRDNDRQPPSSSNGQSAPAPSQITDAQGRNLRAIMAKHIPHVKDDREVVLQVLSTIFSREINSTKELSSAEASTLISNPDTLVEFSPTDAEYKAILANRRNKSSMPAHPTVPCPNRDDKPVDEIDCAGCKDRQGCPSWA